MKSTIKRLLGISIVAGCVISCQVSAFAAEPESEWGIIPDDYVFSVPAPSYTVTVGGEKNNAGYDNTSSESPFTSSEGCSDITAATEDDFPYTLEEFAQYHLERINQIRSDYGLGTLSTDPILTEMAQERVEEYRLGHKRADGSDWYLIFDEYDSDLKPAGENWAASTSDPETQFIGFLSSEGHKANILNEDAAYVGIGVKWNEERNAISVIQLYAK